MIKDDQTEIIKEKLISNLSYALDKSRFIIDQLNITEGEMVDRLGDAYNHFNMMKSDRSNVTIENGEVMNEKLVGLVDMIEAELLKRKL